MVLSRWKPEPSPKDQCFDAIKAGIDALPIGAKMVLNGGERWFSTSTRSLTVVAYQQANFTGITSPLQTSS